MHALASFKVKFQWSPKAERKYDVGNRELSTVKLALEEWCHWLEETKSSFLVWTDQKNLAYIRTAKRCNARQWALFYYSIIYSSLPSWFEEHQA